LAGIAFETLGVQKREHPMAKGCGWSGKSQYSSTGQNRPTHFD